MGKFFKSASLLNRVAGGAGTGALSGLIYASIASDGSPVRDGVAGALAGGLLGAGMHLVDARKLESSAKKVVAEGSPIVENNASKALTKEEIEALGIRTHKLRTPELNKLVIDNDINLR